MNSAFSLFTVRGISIRVHFTFPLILIWGAIQFGVLSGRGLPGALFGVIVTLILFAIVVLHELGHSVAAQGYGVPVKEIVLLPIGGVAQLSRIPEEPVQEFVIAIAGPLVNFAIALVMGLAALIFQIGTGLENPLSMLRDLSNLSLLSVFNYVFISNLFLGVFNLLPAFPMDGGRVLRALLATRLPYVRATTIAVGIGQVLAWLLGLWGFLGGGFFLILIAIFIYMGAGQEGRMVQVRNVLGSLTVDQAYSRQARSISPEATLREAVQLTLTTFQADFPVCDSTQLVGLLTHAALVEALDRTGPATPVKSVMLTDIAPVTPDDGLFTVQQRMQENNLDALPVVEEGSFLGLITSRDINELYRLVSRQPDLLPATT
jgi:Zn-dependent protease/CBS domain-containing protein